MLDDHSIAVISWIFFITAYPSELFGDFSQTDILIQLAFVSVISSVLQGLILFPDSWQSVLKWLVIGLTLGIAPFIDLMSMLLEDMVSYGLFLNLPTQLRFDSAVFILIFLFLYLLPGLIASAVTGLIFGLIIQSISLNELSPKFRKENSAA